MTCVAHEEMCHKIVRAHEKDLTRVMGSTLDYDNASNIDIGEKKRNKQPSSDVSAKSRASEVRVQFLQHMIVH